jgi:hypothetical protein
LVLATNRSRVPKREDIRNMNWDWGFLKLIPYEIVIAVVIYFVAKQIKKNLQNKNNQNTSNEFQCEEDKNRPIADNLIERTTNDEAKNRDAKKPPPLVFHKRIISRRKP